MKLLLAVLLLISLRASSQDTASVETSSYAVHYVDGKEVSKGADTAKFIFLNGTEDKNISVIISDRGHKFVFEVQKFIGVQSNDAKDTVAYVYGGKYIFSDGTEIAGAIGRELTKDGLAEIYVFLGSKDIFRFKINLHGEKG